RPLKIIIPPGKILSAAPPAPVGNWSRTLPTVIDLILRALAPAMPEKIAAGHKGDMGGYAFFGVDPKTRRRFLCQTIMGGGWGGRAHEDGENATVSMCQGGVRAKALVKPSPEAPGVWLAKKPNFPLKKNGSVTFFTAGGGGYGRPEE